jgi:hypothetical protein
MTTGILAAGTSGGDSDQVCDLATAQALHAAGVRFLLRYITRTSPQHTGDLSISERAAILHASVAVGYVQHCPLAGWAPSRARGQAYGIAAASNLKSIGASPGVCVWRDWEGVLPNASSADSIADINSWNAAVIAGGFVPGIYFGYNGILDGSDLYWRLTCSHYWKSASTVPVPEIRGWQLVQSFAPSPVVGYDWDRDVVMQDSLGGLPIWDLP